MTNKSSSSSIPNTQSSSATPIPEEVAYAQQFNIQQPKPPTVGQIKAQGDVKTKITVIWFVGIVCVMLIIIGGIAMVVNPEEAKDIWIVIGPIVSSAVTGTVAFLTGEKHSASK